jgi:hypothetical protein
MVTWNTTPIASLLETMTIETGIMQTAVRKSKNGTVSKGSCSGAEHEKVGQLSQLSNHYPYDSVY